MRRALPIRQTNAVPNGMQTGNRELQMIRKPRNKLRTEDTGLCSVAAIPSKLLTLGTLRFIEATVRL